MELGLHVSGIQWMVRMTEQVARMPGPCLGWETEQSEDAKWAALGKASKDGSTISMLVQYLVGFGPPDSVDCI